MRLMIVGAGASYAECKAKGLPEELCMPLMKDLSRKLWEDFNPTPFLEVFLVEQGCDVDGIDPVNFFYDLEQKSPGLIEEFFASAWRHRNEFHTPYGRRWNDLMYHGFLRPLNFILVRGLLADNPETRLPLSESVAAKLAPGDLVLNLNYDLIFDVALKNAGKRSAYSPHERPDDGVWIFKPHGSFHMAVDEEKQSFWFGQVEFIGDVQPQGGDKTFLSFVPPRKSKSFDQHPVAAAIVGPLMEMKPDVVTYWGVGTPESDRDLLELYKKFCGEGIRVEFVNPSQGDAAKMEAQLGRPITHYIDASAWLARA